MEHMWQIKFGRAISVTEVPMRREESSPHNRSASPGFQDHEGSPHYLAAKTSGDWDWGCCWSQKSPLKGPTHRLKGPSELQYWGSSLKGTKDIQGKPELSGIRPRAEGQLYPRQKAGRDHYSFAEPSLQSASRWALRFHQHGSHSLPIPNDSLRPTRPNFSSLPQSCVQWLKIDF